MDEKQIKDSPIYEQTFHYKERRSNRNFIFVLAMIVMFVFGLRLWWQTAYSGVQVDGDSMNMTLRHGEKLLVEKTGWWNSADYGDVIVVQVDGYAEWKGAIDKSGNQVKFIIKRLIAKEGDSVYAKDGVVYLKKSGESKYTALKEPYAYYGAGNSYKNYYEFASYAEPYKVGVGEIFFLGDNRSTSYSSEDSRYKENKSKLKYLYKETDIYGTVPDWAIKYQAKIENVFF
ncbi:MAG: signal peptidase I [Clostridia bacterium]|nr:signal peptidase I [Clostridia bacterium]